ncbi:Gfo/Idh/MocA family protein [Vibrio sp. HN007]|uniref:Gfo/Idh/MocA family protein n=1 Tax=Vibrio iocasae TaxID=3098914 RepID=UPI0035D465FA
MKIAVIGLGDIACKAYLPVITQLPNIELVFCSRNQTRLSELAGQYRIKDIETDYKKLLEHKVDAVMIHAATSAHYDIASYFIGHRIATFVDKPLVDNAEQVELLYEQAAKNNAVLYVGFNRRHIPLFNQHINELSGTVENKLTSLRWEKNRHNLPGDPRTFIFDDFIHPLDSINLNNSLSLEDIHITVQKSEQRLLRLDVQWQIEGTIYEASMNRQCGATFEKVTAGYTNQLFEFDSFVQGRCFKNNQQSFLGLKDWTPMLESKGFVHMIKDWISVVHNGSLNTKVIERNIKTHQIADYICAQITK